MGPTVGDLMGVLEGLAPSDLAEDWDNVGLQVGSRSWAVRRVMVALDPSPEVVAEACRDAADLLVTHHPLTLKPFRRIDLDSPFGAVAQMAVAHRLAVVAAHTNLDSAAGGINDVLVERLGLEAVFPLVPARIQRTVRLDVWSPAGLAPAVAGCLDGASPAPGRQPESRARADEGSDLSWEDPGAVTRVTRVMARSRVSAALEALAEALPGAPLQHEVRPLERISHREGMGRVGRLPEPMTAARFTSVVKERLRPSCIRRVGRPDRRVQCVAVCSGSGGSLLEAFFSSRADLFITGDIRYHDARVVEEKDRCLLDIGHFDSEHLITASLKDRLEARMAAEAWDVSIRLSTSERSPFQAC